jgi:hypothetical protein
VRAAHGRSGCLLCDCLLTALRVVRALRRTAEMNKWRTVTAIVAPCCVLFSIYSVATASHHSAEKIVRAQRTARALALAQPQTLLLGVVVR